MAEEAPKPKRLECSSAQSQIRIGLVAEKGEKGGWSLTSRGGHSSSVFRSLRGGGSCWSRLRACSPRLSRSAGSLPSFLEMVRQAGSQGK